MFIENLTMEEETVYPDVLKGAEITLYFLAIETPIQVIRIQLLTSQYHALIGIVPVVLTTTQRKGR